MGNRRAGVEQEHAGLGQVQSGLGQLGAGYLVKHVVGLGEVAMPASHARVAPYKHKGKKWP